eukprot:364787-Chlamydomonas_euryale.AAC.13
MRYPSRIQSQSKGYRERTHKGYAYVERSKTEEIKQRTGRWHPSRIHTNIAGLATSAAPEHLQLTQSLTSHA